MTVLKKNTLIMVRLAVTGQSSFFDVILFVFFFWLFKNHWHLGEHHPLNLNLDEDKKL